MSLEKLIAAIEGKAREEAGAILSKARDEARGILQEGARQVDAEAGLLRQTTLDRCKKEAAQRLSQARLAARNHVLEVEQELVDAAFEGALQALLDMDDEAYRAWMRRQLSRACRSPEETVISPGTSGSPEDTVNVTHASPSPEATVNVTDVNRSSEETVIVARADRERLPPEWVHETLASLPAANRPLDIVFTGDGPGHGFLLNHPKYEVNVTYEALLHAARHSLRTEVAKWLLGGE